MAKKILVLGLGVVIIAGAVWYFQGNKEGEGSPLPAASDNQSAQQAVENPAQTLVATAIYNCDGGKTITAEFYQGEKIEVAAGQMPVPAGSVKINLSDGRNLELAQTVSADGGRYANEDESFVFWDKGGTALVLEGGIEKDYTDCAMDQTEAAPQ